VAIRNDRHNNEIIVALVEMDRVMTEIDQVRVEGEI